MYALAHQVRRLLANPPRSGDLTYLVTDSGRPFSIKGFGNKFREWCDEAGLPHCSAHGIRKADASLAAEEGATSHRSASWIDFQPNIDCS